MIEIAAFEPVNYDEAIAHWREPKAGSGNTSDGSCEMTSRSCPMLIRVRRTPDLADSEKGV